MSTIQITDEMLTAYLDGELDELQAAQIKAAIASRPEVSQRVRSLEIVKQDLKPAFDLFLNEAPAAPSFETPQKPSRSWSFLKGIAAACAIGAILMITYPFDRTAGLSFPERVAIYQELYTYETIASLSFSESQKSSQLDFLTDRVGYDLTSFGQIDGLNFLRGQLLSLDGANLAHLSYLSESGRPIALCAVPMADADTPGTEVMEIRGLTAVTWNDAGYAFILIGDLEDDLVDTFIKSLG